MRKIVYVVLDGLGDLPIKSLGDKTPLEAAETPNMDLLARKGVTGRMYTVGKKIAPQSDIAVISILGYDPNVYYTGRGPLESFASGLEVRDGDLALRVNFATVDGKWNIIDRRVGRNLSSEEAGELAEAINREVMLTSIPATFEFKSTIGHRGCLVIRAKEGRLSGEVTNTDPAYDKIGPLGVAKEKFENIVQEAKPTAGHENDTAAINAARLVNEFTRKSYEVLERHPINRRRCAEGKMPGNMILCRDAGDHLPKFPPFKERFGLRFASFVEMPVERGIAVLMGIEIVELPPPSGDLARDYVERASLALENIGKFDGLYIHIKGPDEPAHDGDVEMKMRAIEMIDRHFFGPLLEKLDLGEAIVAVTADHSTPCEHKAHTDDPVPILISGGNIQPDGSKAFSERVAENGSIGLLEKGTEFMPLLIKMAGC
jgi:2,3-bisphosphoglycerate-independent phosphoglycerate mutase